MIWWAGGGCAVCLILAIVGFIVDLRDTSQLPEPGSLDGEVR